MCFWNKEIDNAFDHLFDFNNDGKLSASEQAIKYDFLDRITRADDEDDDEC